MDFPHTGSVMWETRGSWGQDHHDFRTITHPTDCIRKVITRSTCNNVLNHCRILCRYNHRIVAMAFHIYAINLSLQETVWHTFFKLECNNQFVGVYDIFRGPSTETFVYYVIMWNSLHWYLLRTEIIIINFEHKWSVILAHGPCVVPYMKWNYMFTDQR